MKLERRDWVPAAIEDHVAALLDGMNGLCAEGLLDALDDWVEQNRHIHESDCINLNPATNVMNPKAERMLASGLGSRPSLGYPGDKYETGLEAIERIEVLATALACEVFKARFAELRVPSGAIANLYAFMATCRPASRIIAPPPEIGGHVTHHRAGAAGLYGLEIHAAPVDPERYTVDLDALRRQALALRPALITIGGSLNPFPHPVREVKSIAAEVGARLLFDAAHLSGPIAGGAWPNPLDEGADLMTMSTYKSLGGPPAGLVLTNDPALAERLDRIAFPGLTANFDVAKTAALAVTLLDWKRFGPAYAADMIEAAKALADALHREGVPVFAHRQGATRSHQFAVEAARYGGGQAAAQRLRRANILACGIGLPIAPVDGDLNGLRLGTPEAVRWGMGAEAMPAIAAFIAGVLERGEDPDAVAAEVSRFRSAYREIRYAG
jgi:glycine hydroxymethyltransferase